MGVRGELGWVCGADGRRYCNASVVVDPSWDLPCTRLPGHPGLHVAAHTDGRVLAVWATRRKPSRRRAQYFLKSE